MPMYDYVCQDCQHHQEHLVKNNDTSICCPHCGSTNYVKQLAAPTVSGSSSEQKSFSQSGACGHSCACHPH